MTASYFHSSHYPDVTIVGAGSSGLTAAYYLQQQGLRVLILDGHTQLAASWRARHPQLHLNTHRWLSSLPGRSLPKRAGAFVCRDDVVSYLEAYARWLSHLPGIEIRTGITVEAIHPHGEQWRLDTSTGTLMSAQVVIATGPDRQPVIPSWPGRKQFNGEIRHAAQFGAVSHYRHKRVLIVGGGNSGIDIANHLLRAGHCRALWIAMRHGTHLLPTRVCGIPVQLTAPLLGLLPLGWQDTLARWMARASFGDLRPFGIRPPAKGALSRLREEGIAPAFDEGFVAGLRQGRIQVVSPPSRFDRASVTLTSGEQIVPDTVICATGYRPALETMVGHLGVLSERGTPIVNAPQSDPAHPGLWLFGMTARIEGNLLARRWEARRLARQISRQWLRQPLCSPAPATDRRLS